MRHALRRPALFSRLARVIFLSHIIGLIVLMVGAMAMQRFSQGLIQAKIENLTSQTELITTIMGDTATGIGLSASLDEQNARALLRRVELPDPWRIRLYDKQGHLIADSLQLDRDIDVGTLDPITVPGTSPDWTEDTRSKFDGLIERALHNLPWRTARRDRLRQNAHDDIRKALLGQTVAGERYNADDALIVSVTKPVKRVQQVLGVVVLESTDVDSIVNGERRALAPIIGLAFLTALLSSLALTLFIALPVRRLARAADTVSRSNRTGEAIPDLSRRRDEIGDLSVVMRDMTNALHDRINDIANFAADVAHEIKNPLTSLRSASDTLRVAKTDDQRRQLIDVIQSDVARMDRLISDISKASKVDANLARETAQIINVRELLSGLTEFYVQTQAQTDDAPQIRFDSADGPPVHIRAFETPFAQVLRNLIDNALTFSPKGGEVMIKVDTLTALDEVRITVEDEGPGIPTDNLETVFERFYTQRPKGAQFGSHSGLGLAISRQIVHAHRGNIWAENRKVATDEDAVIPVRGARFVITVPIYDHGDAAHPAKRRKKATDS